MNFENLTSSQLAAFILGIIFSVFAVVSVLIAIKKTKSIKISTSSLLLLLLMPFIAFVCWFFLIFSFVNGFNEFTSLMTAIIISIVVCVMIVVVTLALYKRNKQLMTQEEVDALWKLETEARKYLDGKRNQIQLWSEEATADAQTDEPQQINDVPPVKISNVIPIPTIQ